MEPQPGLALYTLFHLNLAYSAIEEGQRPAVIRRCYWPLLELAEEGLPVAIELTGFTLETIHTLDPAWVERFRRLLAEGRCELIGSGRSQLIGPLVPAAVNRANLRLGMADYRSCLGLTPRIALINEQAYSADLVPLYLEAGFEAIIMEWDNPAASHPEWLPEWRYRPQRALGSDGSAIPLIWCHSIAFQKFQRYAHGELELDEFIAYLDTHAAGESRLLSLYANDAEVFDFRPGRYGSEPALTGGEWERIGTLLRVLRGRAGVELLLPSAALARLCPSEPLRLESPALPVPVKKQQKYNLTRWAVTGRDDLTVNTLCLRLCRALERRGAGEEEWRALCDLWASDYRTHITEARWREYRARLAEACRRHGVTEGELPPLAAGLPGPAAGVAIERRGRFLELTTDRVVLRLNCRRGLAIEALSFDGEGPLIGTLPHGYFDAISLGADWYSGHLVAESPGAAKVTDLLAVEPRLSRRGAAQEVAAVIETPLGPIEKRLRVTPRQAAVELEFRIPGGVRRAATLRAGFITLVPEAFDRHTLRFAAANGGTGAEPFHLQGPFEHGRAVSHLVSAATCLGLTDGRFLLGDGRRQLRIELERERAAAVGLVTFQPEGERYLLRVGFSLAETDETRRPAEGEAPVSLCLRIALHAGPAAGHS